MLGTASCPGITCKLPCCCLLSINRLLGVDWAILTHFLLLSGYLGLLLLALFSRSFLVLFSRGCMLVRRVARFRRFLVNWLVYASRAEVGAKVSPFAACIATTNTFGISYVVCKIRSISIIVAFLIKVLFHLLNKSDLWFLILDAFIDNFDMILIHIEHFFNNLGLLLPVCIAQLSRFL